MPEPPITATSPGRSRLDKLRAGLGPAGIDALIVSRIENVRYLSGFTGSTAALLVTPVEAVLVTDSRYAEQAAAESPDFAIEVAPGVATVLATQTAVRMGARRTGFEADGVSYDLWESMMGGLPHGHDAVLIPCRGQVERLRIVKSSEELALLQKAVDITSAAFEQTLCLVRPGAVERELALEIEFRMKQAGAEELSFDLIVASGPRSSLPHGRASDRVVGAGEFIVFDIGARFRGYHSDMTRTVFTGTPGVADRTIYETVLASQLAGIDRVAPGAPCREVDQAARGYIERTGHAGRFGHGTGHGVGLCVHEAPRVGPLSEEVLAPGMVVTVEPGIYIPGAGGVRIEDMVVVTSDGHRVMTPTPKDTWILE